MTTEQILNQITFDPPRWKGGPQICTATNLPAFETKDSLMKFLESIAMAGRLERFWLCEHCKWLHHECKPPTPSGSSSGTERD